MTMGRHGAATLEAARWRLLRQRLDEHGARWDWHRLSTNPAVPVAFALANADLPWQWADMSARPDASWERVISAHPDKPWDFFWVSQRADLTLAAVRDQAHLPWRWDLLSCNPCFSYEDVASTADALPWDWTAVARNPSVSTEHLDARPAEAWGDWRAGASCNPNVTPEYVGRHPDRDWDYGELSRNPRFAWEDVAARPDAGWCWYAVSMKPSVTWEAVQAHPHLPWNWAGLSQNPAVATWETVLNNLEADWDWHYLSLLPTVSWRLISDTLDLFPWEPAAVSRRQDLSLDAVLWWRARVDWDWRALSRWLPGLSWRAVAAQREEEDGAGGGELPWAWHELSARPDVVWGEEDEAEVARRHLAAFRIQACWRRAVSCPDHAACRRRLLREAAELACEVGPRANAAAARRPRARKRPFSVLAHA